MVGPNRYANSNTVGVSFLVRILLKRCSTISVSIEEGLISSRN